MIDSSSQNVLQDLIRRESRSLLQYVSESFPWITSEEQEALARLRRITREELDGAAVIARFLAKNRIVPLPPGPYPMNFTNMNYVSLDHLLPLLVEYQKRRIRDLERDLSRIADAPSRQHADNYLAMKRRHLQMLEDMVKSLSKPQPVGAAS